MRMVVVLMTLAMLSGSGLCFGQTAEQDLWIQSQLGSLSGFAGALDAQDLSNINILQQMGSSNAANVQQVVWAAGPDPNQASVSQEGSNNTATLSQAGNGNQSDIHQIGGENYLLASLTGRGNSSVLIQEGFSNQLSQVVSGVGMTLDAAQYGARHQLVQVETGGMSVDYKVEQKGDGARLVIVNGAIPSGAASMLMHLGSR